MWLTYLGLEPYIRRFSPDSLIGWTRLISGRWRDPHVGRDVLIGISAGLAMTILYAAHNFIPPLFGRPEPMPTLGRPEQFSWVRATCCRSSSALFSSAIINSMLAVVRHRRAADSAETRVAGVAGRQWRSSCGSSIQGMFPAGTPILDLAIGLGIIGIYVGVILRWGLLATIAALFTHFMLLRAPFTTDFNSWRATAASPSHLCSPASDCSAHGSRDTATESLITNH